MIEFISGAGFSLFLVIFLGWFDVRFLGRPQSEPVFGNWKLTYAVICAWELMFFIIGVLIGKLL